MDMSTLKRIIQFADISAKIILECNPDDKALKLLIEKDIDPDTTFSVEIPRKTEDAILYGVGAHEHINSCDILTQELKNIVDFFTEYHQYLTFGFHAPLVKKNGYLRFGTNPDEKIPTPQFSIDLHTNTQNTMKLRLQCTSGKLICEKPPQLKIKKFTSKDPTTFEIDGKHFKKVLDRIVQYKGTCPSYVTLGVFSSHQSPLSISYPISSVGTVKTFIALMYD